MKPTARLHSRILRPRVFPTVFPSLLASVLPSLLPVLAALPLVACVGASAGTGFTDAPRPDESEGTDSPGARAHSAGTGSAPPPVVDGDPTDPSALPPGCDASALPTQDACTMHESLGVFVSSSLGNDPPPPPAPQSPKAGTRAAPFATLRAAIEVAAKTHRRVYACAETYAENLTVTSGVSIFGYFDCDKGWRVGSTFATVFAPSSPAATATDITTPTRLEGLAIQAPRGIQLGESSISLIAVRSPALSLVGVQLQAGRGAPGADGDDAVQLVQTGAIDGAPSMSASEASACIATFGAPSCTLRYGGGRGGVSQCSGMPNMNGGPGGKGGKAGQYEPDPNIHLVVEVSPSEAGFPALSSPQTAAGAAPITPATAGANGAAGSDGASASTIGTFSETGYTPADGKHGSNGAPGQGGGGGRAGRPPGVLATRWFGSSGSGGGAGGCPGLAGTAGRGGGASVALLAIDSPMHIESSNLFTDRGGAGGRGTVGSEPTAGGSPGAMIQTDPLTGGAPGGRGGRAGVSGHGAGGPSIVIASHGAPPVVVSSTLTPAVGGPGQAAIRTSDRKIDVSIDGISAATHAF